MATWTHDTEICLLRALFGGRAGLLKYLIGKVDGAGKVFRVTAWPGDRTAG